MSLAKSKNKIWLFPAVFSAGFFLNAQFYCSYCESAPNLNWGVEIAPDKVTLFYPLILQPVLIIDIAKFLLVEK